MPIKERFGNCKEFAKEVVNINLKLMKSLEEEAEHLQEVREIAIRMIALEERRRNALSQCSDKTWNKLKNWKPADAMPEV